MVAKIVIFICAQTFVTQSIAAQCMGAGLAAVPLAAATSPWSFAAAPCGAFGPIAATTLGASPFAIATLYGAGPAAASASHGGGLPIASASAIPPSGVALVSENAYEGVLAVAGAVPFLGTVSLEGALPTAGAAAVAYGCGNGEVAMLTEDIGAAAGPLGYVAGNLAYEIGPLGYGFGALSCEAPLAAPANGRIGCGYGAFL